MIGPTLMRRDWNKRSKNTRWSKKWIKTKKKKEKWEKELEKVEEDIENQAEVLKRVDNDLYDEWDCALDMYQEIRPPLKKGKDVETCLESRKWTSAVNDLLDIWSACSGDIYDLREVDRHSVPVRLNINHRHTLYG